MEIGRSISKNALWHIMIPGTNQVYCQRSVNIHRKERNPDKIMLFIRHPLKKNPCKICYSIWKRLDNQEYKVASGKVGQSDVVLCLRRCYEKLTSPSLRYLKYSREFLPLLIQELSRVLKVNAMDPDLVPDMKKSLDEMEVKASMRSLPEIEESISQLRERKLSISREQNPRLWSKIELLLETYKWILSDGRTDFPPDYHFFYPSEDRKELLDADVMNEYRSVYDQMDAIDSLGKVHAQLFKTTREAYVKSCNGFLKLDLLRSSTPGEE